MAVKHVTITGASTNQEDITSGTRPILMGYQIMESAGTPAAWEVKIYEGATVSGGELIAMEQGSGDTGAVQWFGPNGIESYDGVSVEAVSGTFDIVVYYTTG